MSSEFMSVESVDNLKRELIEIIYNDFKDEMKVINDKIVDTLKKDITTRYFISKDFFKHRLTPELANYLCDRFNREEPVALEANIDDSSPDGEFQFCLETDTIDNVYTFMEKE